MKRTRKVKIGFEVVLEPAEEGGFVVHCPALKGCHSEGDTEEEALKNIQEAIEGYLLVLGERKERRAASGS